MKTMFAVLTLTFLLAINVSAQETRTAVSMIDSARRHNDTFFSWDVFATRTNPTLPIFVGVSSFYFNFNSTALTNPTLTYINPNYTGDGSGNYSPMTVQIVTVLGIQYVAVTINYVGNLGPGTSLPTSPERLFRVTMTILDQSANANLSWNEIDSGIGASNPVFVQNVFIGGNNGPLPVQLATFTATAERGRGIRLRWTTVSEVNNYGFYVQRRSSEEPSWIELANSFVAGHGTTSQPQNYAYLDNSAQAGSWQYRLRQVDLDGTEHFTEPISISSPTAVAEQAPIEYALKQNYPNPFNPTTTIAYDVPRTSHVKLTIHNTLGQEVARLVDARLEPGRYETQWQAAGFASGIYFYRLESKEFTRVMKLVVLK